MAKQKAPKQSPYALEVAKISKAAMQRYKEKYYPVEQQFARDVQGSEQGLTRQALGQANVANQMAFAQQEPAIQLANARAGVDPSSGRGLLQAGGMAADQGMANGKGLAGAANAANGTYFQNLAQLVAQGKGQETQALATNNRLADESTRQAILDARASAASRQAMQGAIGTGLGYAAGSFMNKSAQQPAALGMQPGEYEIMKPDFTNTPAYGVGTNSYQDPYYATPTALGNG